MNPVDADSANAFASILKNFDAVASGEKTKAKGSSAERMAQNDMTSILESFTRSTSTFSEAAPDTLTAKEKPRDISPVVGSSTDPDHPFDGKLVGEEQEPVAEHNGGDTPAIRELQDIADELEGLGRRAAQILGNHFPEALRRAEAYGALQFGSSSNPHDTTLRSIIDDIDNGEYDNEQDDEMYEDILGKLQDELGDVLRDVADSLDDKEILDKHVKGDSLGPAVKTIKTDDGHELKIHGNEDDGFRITIKNKPSKSSFNSLDEATLAVEAYCARRSQ